MDDATIVLLAAGRATRMRGRDKLLEEVAGGPLLQVMARRAARAGATRVVLGPGQSARRAALEGLSIEIVEAPDDSGMGVSIAAGVAGLTGPVMILPSDMPEITAADLHLILSLGAQGPPGLILRAASDAGVPGHPVLFPADFLPDLARLNSDEGARSVLSRAQDRLRLVPLKGARAITDLDTPEAWTAWREAQDRRPKVY